VPSILICSLVNDRFYCLHKCTTWNRLSLESIERNGVASCCELDYVTAAGKGALRGFGKRELTGAERKEGVPPFTQQQIYLESIGN